jgi:hypothetical protein
MIPVKILLTSLVGVSLCIANISGVDHNATPIAGAVGQSLVTNNKDTINFTDTSQYLCFQNQVKFNKNQIVIDKQSKIKSNF